jgi:hypothetical protein
MKQYDNIMPPNISQELFRREIKKALLENDNLEEFSKY